MGVVILYDEYLAPRLHGDLVPYFSSDIVHNTRLHIYYIIGNILIGDRSTDQSCFSLQKYKYFICLMVDIQFLNLLQRFGLRIIEIGYLLPVGYQERVISFSFKCVFINDFHDIRFLE